MPFQLSTSKDASNFTHLAHHPLRDLKVVIYLKGSTSLFRFHGSCFKL